MREGGRFPAVPESVKGFAYEFRRAFVSPSLLAVLVIVSLASLAIVPSIREQAAPAYQIEESSAVYYVPGAYHFAVSVFDNYGRAIPAVVVWANMTTNLTQCGECGPKAIGNVSGVTDDGGFADLAWPHNNNTFVMVSLSLDGKPYGSGGLFYLASYPSNAGLVHFPVGKVSPLVGFTSDIRPNTAFAAEDALQAFFVGPNGTSAAGDRVYYLVPTNNTDLISGSFAGNGLPYLPSGWMVSLGNLSSNRTSFPLTLVPVANASTSPGLPGSELFVELFDRSGRFLAISVSPLVPSDFYATNFHALASTLVLNFVVELLGLFVPLMAVLAGYSNYGKDRVSGVLESVLAAPVSRLGLALSRYLAILGVLAIAGGVSIGVLDAVVHLELGFFLPFGVTGPLFAGLLVEAASFVGLVLVASHLLRSNFSLITAGLVAFAGFVYFWSYLVVIGSGLTGEPPGSPAYLHLELGLDFFSPGQFLPLLAAYLSGGASLNAGPVDLSSLGITAASLAATAVVWVALPLAAFLRLARSQD